MNLKITETKKYDIVICGAGCAGFCAAVSAARLGCRVALVEKYYGPGGILTVLGNNSIDRFNNPFRKSGKMVITGIGWELVMKLYKDGFAAVPDMDAPYENHWQYGVRVNPVAAAKTMDDMLIQSGADLFYGQPAVDVITAGRLIDGVVIASKSGLRQLFADIFIDCTGDGDIAFFAGAETLDGDGKGNFQPGTLRFYPATDSKERIFDCGDNRNHVVMNVTDSDSLTRSEIYARAMIYSDMVGSGERIMAVAPAVAPREGRRIAGITEMKAEDYRNGTVFDDSVCYTHWFIDIHRNGRSSQIEYVKNPETPTVRLSSMISKNFDNLMMAGRCISSDRETNSALRVKASCMAMGQAVGTAAYTAIADRKAVKDVSVLKVKDSLAEQGAVVPGLCRGLDFRKVML